MCQRDNIPTKTAENSQRPPMGLQHIEKIPDPDIYTCIFLNKQPKSLFNLFFSRNWSFKIICSNQIAWLLEAFLCWHESSLLCLFSEHLMFIIFWNIHNTKAWISTPSIHCLKLSYKIICLSAIEMS